MGIYLKVSSAGGRGCAIAVEGERGRERGGGVESPTDRQTLSYCTERAQGYLLT